jgi:hypothetical protein
LYLPSYYSSEKKSPCIFFFDSHARGSLPVRSYKDLAEKYGFILVGSNVSKNGTRWEVTNDGVKVMIKDTRSRINIDPTRIYTAGFSGGSRVASSVAIMDGGIAGVIGCAAGFPSMNVKPQSKFDYFGMVGDYDFNYTEMKQLDGALEHNGFAHQLLTFSGIHGWPPSSDFQTALLWMQANGTKEKLQPKNDTIIAALKSDLNKRITAADASRDWIKSHELLAGIVNVLEGLSDVSVYKKQLAELETKPDYKNAAVLQAEIQIEESNRQQELQKEFTMYDDKWWAKKITELNQKNKSAKTQQESQMYKRLINYLGLVGYMNSSHSLNIGNLTNAATYLKIFKMADPQNPDCSYLTAIYYMKSGNQQQAILSLKEAASLGYSEVTQITSDPAFLGLQNDPEFKNLVARVRENYTSK